MGQDASVGSLSGSSPTCSRGGTDPLKVSLRPGLEGLERGGEDLSLCSAIQGRKGGMMGVPYLTPPPSSETQLRDEVRFWVWPTLLLGESLGHPGGEGREFGVGPPRNPIA